MAMTSGSTQTETSYREMFNGSAPDSMSGVQPSTPLLPGNRLRHLRQAVLMLRQVVVDTHPGDLLRHPDVLGRCKSVAVVEGGERHADRGAVGASRKQPGTAGLAKLAVESCRRRIASGLAFDAERAGDEQRAGVERRAHRLLAIAAMAD